MFKKMISWIRQVMSMFMPNAQGQNSIGKIPTLFSSEMANAIDLWMKLYMGQASWLERDRKSLGLPAAIASEMSRMVTLELKMDVEGSARAEFLHKAIKPIKDNIRLYCEYACAGGGLMFKPYVTDSGIAIDVTQATEFYPTAFNSSGIITSCIFIEHKTVGNRFYHRLETHEYKSNTYTITNEAYESTVPNELGKEVSLTVISDWSILEAEQQINGISGPLFSYFKIPLGNTVDPTSPLGVSVYARAVGLIEDADVQYQRLMWEFEGGELAIDASQDAFRIDKNGKAQLPVGKERLFRANELEGATCGSESLKTFSPTLRDASLKNGLNTILQKIEFNCGLAYGTLSDPQTVDKTATEIKSSKQRTYSHVTDIQKALQTALENLIYAIDVYASLYKLAPEGKYNISFVWDDSIIVDAEAERLRDMQEVKAKLLPEWKYIMKWQGLNEEEAKAQVEEMRSSSDESMNPFNMS